MSNDTIKEMKGLLQAYVNRIVLDKLSVEEILSLLDADIKYLREAEGNGILTSLTPDQ